MIIYAITNTVNGKRYVGMTTQPLNERMSRHRWDVNNGSSHAIHRAIRKYGWEAFDIQPLVYLMPGLRASDLSDLEKLVIAQEGTFGGGYNETPGGEGWAELNISRKGKPSPKRGQPMHPNSKAAFAAYWTPERRAERGKNNGDLLRGKPGALKGTKLSDEHRAKLRAAWARSPARKAKLAELGKRPMTDEQKAKIAATLRKPEHADKLRERNAAMNKTAEHGRKISEGHARRRERLAAEQERIAA